MEMLKTSQKFELISKLRACPIIKERKMSEIILRQLPEKIARQISYNERDDVHITNIVDACLNYRGGLEELIDIIHYYEQDSQPMCEIDVFFDNTFPTVIGRRSFRELKNIIREIKCSAHVIDNIYRASIPSEEKWLFPLDSNDVEKLFEMVKTLADAPIRRDGKVPLFIFVSLLIKELESRRSLSKKLNPQSPYKRLRRWLGVTAKEHGLSNNLVDEKLPTPSPAPSTLSYLLVAIKPNDYDPQYFTVQAWLLNSEYKSVVQLYAEDERGQRSLKEIEKLFDCLVTESRRRLGGGAPQSLIIEFSLPSSTLCSNIDHWFVKGGLHSLVPVGIEHPVLVRSYERAHNQVLWAPWKALWEQYQNSNNK